MKFGMTHAPDAGSIARPVDQQSDALPLTTPWYIIQNKITQVEVQKIPQQESTIIKT